jgi:hypothetical protein
MPGVLLVGSMCVSAFFSDVQRSKHQEALDDDVLPGSVHTGAGSLRWQGMIPGTRGTYFFVASWIFN